MINQEQCFKQLSPEKLDSMMAALDAPHMRNNVWIESIGESLADLPETDFDGACARIAQLQKSDCGYSTELPGYMLPSLARTVANDDRESDRLYDVADIFVQQLLQLGAARESAEVGIDEILDNDAMPHALVRAMFKVLPGYRSEY